MRLTPYVRRAKGIAPHILVMVVIFAFTAFALYLIFAGYIPMQNCELARAACATKQSAYCLEWLKNDNTLTSNQPAWTKINTCANDGEIVKEGCEQPDSPMCVKLTTAS